MKPPRKAGAPAGNTNRKGTGTKAGNISLRVSAADRAMIKAKAIRRGMNQSEYLLGLVRADFSGNS